MATGNAGFIKFTTASVRRRRKPNGQGLRREPRIPRAEGELPKAVAARVPLLFRGTGVFVERASRPFNTLQAELELKWRTGGTPVPQGLAPRRLTTDYADEVKRNSRDSLNSSDSCLKATAVSAGSPSPSTLDFDFSPALAVSPLLFRAARGIIKSCFIGI